MQAGPCLYRSHTARSDLTHLKVRRKAKSRNRYNQVPYLTRNTIWDKITKNNTQESQEVNPFPAGDHMVARNRQESITKSITKRIHKRSTVLERSVKNTGGLKPGLFLAILGKGPWPKFGKNDRLNSKIGRN